MRLGGYVLFNDNRATLEGALTSLKATCDEVIGIDSGARDGSAELAERSGVTRVSFPWRGYGAARAEAIRRLSHCDYVLFLDADERMEPASIERLKAWRASGPQADGYRVRLNDNVELEGTRFRFRSGTRLRIVRPPVAAYRPEMIVHESIGLRGAPVLDVEIEHQFLTSLEERGRKQRRYAFLWGLQAFVEGRAAKWSAIERPAHFLGDVVFRGALWRGGALAARVSWEIARYHQLKYEYLQAFKRGAHPEAVAALKRGALEEVFALAESIVK